MELFMTKPLTLVSHTLCPYVQRAAIALSEKVVPFERIYIDLGNKPDWFQKASPLGKVPLLTAGGTHLFESAPILEYLEDTQPRPLHPADPVERARHRAYIEFGSQVLNGIGALYNAPDENGFREQAARLHDHFRHLEDVLDPDGPYFAGAKFSLVDATFGPVFRYFDIFDRIGDFGVFDGLEKVQAWRRELAARRSVQKAVGPAYPADLLAFLKRRKSWVSMLVERKGKAA
jgi:glutathione S-transferase